MSDLESQIVAFVRETTGMKAAEASSRLADDIGLEGDDAVDFFEKFSEKLQVDLTELWEHWHQHFYPEAGPSAGFGVALVAGVVLGLFMHELNRAIPAWAAIIVLTPALCWAYARLFADVEEDGKTPITVQDLVDAAIAGRWRKSYQQAPPQLDMSGE